VAGVWLFLAGLVSGYFDNLAAYSDISRRIAHLPWLRRWAGDERATRIGAYIDHNLGGLSGNLFFGLMLGLTPAIGLAFGLPLDIRHVAFSSANFGYALTTLDFDLSLGEVVRSMSGIALIGMVNLLVSFSLALWVAMRARGAEFKDAANLPPELWRQFRLQPGRFFWAGR
jgi:site-specific recombinase